MNAALAICPSAFVATLFVIPWDVASLAQAFRPYVPRSPAGALVAAGVMGGAVHITLITMTSYTLRARGWNRRDHGLARFDVVTSLFVMFGLYSVAIFLVAAAVLHGNPATPSPLTHLSASLALEDLVGDHAKWLFLIGLWAAAISTLGGNTVVPPYLLAAKLGWGTTVRDRRFRLLVAGFALASAAGAFLTTANFFALLVWVLAFGLVGTPFAIAVVLYLLNHPPAMPLRTPAWMNLAGLGLFLVAGILAANFVTREVLTHGLAHPATFLVTAFAAALTLAMAVLAVKFVAVQSALRAVRARRVEEPGRP